MSELNIHPDFSNITAVELAFKRPFVLKLTNYLLSVAGAIRLAKFKAIHSRHVIISRDGHRVPVWVIKPEQTPTPGAVLLYFHGGGFILKHAPQHIDNAVHYAREANCSVIFVDYRLSPQNTFPAGFNDCYSALTWAIEHAESLGIDKLRIAVGGDSAGAALAATVAQKAVHDDGIALCGQLLIYPVIDSDCTSASSSAFADVPPFRKFSVQTMWEAYLGHPINQGTPAYASPRHGNLSGLAPAYVETVEFDPLRDEGLAYAKALTASGVDVVLNETKGTVHGYDLLAPRSPVVQQSMQARVQFLRRIFQPST